jgi:hypothetical protein
MKPKLSHIFERETHEHYVEPFWCSERLFQVEKFDGPVWDPCCGFGRIPDAARLAGYTPFYSDIKDRGYDPSGTCPWGDFFECTEPTDNIVSNPPFDKFSEFANHALKLATRKVAMLWIVPRLNAARWLQDTPLARVWLLTPRPSMPPGHVISAGGKATGGTQDFCWLVWDKSHSGQPEMRWLRREK